MKRKSRAVFNKAKTFAMLMLVAVFALLSFAYGPVGGLGRINAQVESAVADTAGDGTESAEKIDVELTVYYYSKTGNYNGHNMWLWEDNGGDGSKYKHDFDEGTVEVDGYPGKQWKKLTETIHNVDMSIAAPIGAIIRKTKDGNEWGLQTSNLMLDGSHIKDGKLNVYIVQLSEDKSSISVSVFYNAEDAMANKITRAFFNSLTRVRVETGMAITDKSVFKLKDAEDNVYGTLDCSDAANASVVGAAAFNLVLDSAFEIDFGKKYRVVDDPAAPFDTDSNFTEKEVSFTTLFDMDAFSDFEYSGTLGAEYSAAQTKFTVWSPYATEMKLNIYAAGEGGTATSYDMRAGEKGTWTYTLTGDQNGKYYTYTVINGSSQREIVDPYARSAGRNGKRGMILNLAATNPDGWETHSKPAPRGSYSNAVIYEGHVRDLTIHESSNVTAANRGKFLGLTESSATNGGKTTPLDHIKALGVTELHILPMFDINSVDEYSGNAEYNKKGEYNWGYDPLNYNVPEGSYSSDPTDGAKRVNELKRMIMALHEAGIRVIMDVVYNHVADANGSNFQALMPNYYFRTNADGSFTNGSGCGNDTASERTMYHKFMVDSVNYWADEYKIDGFRFDLMGLHDTLTMNEIYDTLAVKNPDIMVYGEGWEMGNMAETSEKKKADMFHAADMPNIAFFNDITRDALKGGGFGQAITSRGYIEGNLKEAAIYVGAVGGTNNAGAGYNTLSKTAFATNPTQNINYVSCHDNSTLWDKINACAIDADDGLRKAMNRLAAAAVFTSQGPTFFLAGEELLRSKPTTKENDYDNRPEKWLDRDYYFADNSYKSPDSVNAIDWSLAQTNADMVEFYTQLIALRKNSPQFRLTTKQQIDTCLTIADEYLMNGVASYAVKDPASDEYAVVLFNATANAVDVLVPDGEYSVYVNGARADGTTPISEFKGSSFNVGAFSAVVMKGELSADKVSAWKELVTTPKPGPSEPTAPAENDNLGLVLGLSIGIPVAVLAIGGIVFYVLYSKKKKSKG